MKKWLKWVLFSLVIGNATWSFAESNNDNYHVITDMLDRKVTVKQNANSVVDLWHANNQIVLMLGGIKQLTGTTNVIHANPWINKIFPEIKNIPVLTDGSSLQIEELLKINPDVILTSNKNFVDQLERFNLNVVYVSFKDMDNLKKTVLITGEALGEESTEKAKEYIKDLDKNIQYVKDKLNGTKTDVKILAIGSASNLYMIDGGKSIAGEWINIAGATSAFPDVDNKKVVSLEEIIKANPDIIIIGSRNAKQGIEQIKNDPAWQDINAVKHNRIYANPIGIFAWDRYSGEEALQVLWIAKKVNPEQFADLDMMKEVQQFYKKYYDYELSDEDATRLLNSEDPTP